MFDNWGDGDRLKISIRESTQEELDTHKFERYVCYNPDNDNVYTVFGLLQGGKTREEAVYWAERMASKNDLSFVRPEGWEDVEGDLPEEFE